MPLQSLHKRAFLKCQRNIMLIVNNCLCLENFPEHSLLSIHFLILISQTAGREVMFLRDRSEH